MRRPPSYRLHKASGQAIVTFDRRDYYLGKYGTSESRNAYNRLVAEYLAGREQLLKRDTQGQPSIAELCNAYRIYAEDYYRNNDGERDRIKSVVILLRTLYGETVARDFGPLALKAVRQKMIEKGWRRGQINARVSLIKRIVRWGVENEIIPVEVHQSLACVAGLRKGKSDAVESKKVIPADPAHVKAVLPFLSHPVRAMVELHALTGMRSTELCIMRPMDLDRKDAELWIYTPNSHKTEHHGHSRAVPLGPRCQEVITPFLFGRAPDAYLFDPRELGRRARQPRYNARSYEHAIRRACGKANVPRFNPHRLRHMVGTAIRDAFGLDAAQALLGHRHARTAEIYAEVQLAKAKEVMKKLG